MQEDHSSQISLIKYCSINFALNNNYRYDNEFIGQSEFSCSLPKSSTKQNKCNNINFDHDFAVSVIQEFNLQLCAILSNCFQHQSLLGFSFQGKTIARIYLIKGLGSVSLGQSMTSEQLGQNGSIHLSGWSNITRHLQYALARL